MELRSKDKGAVYLEFGTRIAVGQETSMTGSEAKIAAESPVLERLLASGGTASRRFAVARSATERK